MQEIGWSHTEIKAAYPDYQLPRGTFGWEPATATVNGGPDGKLRQRPQSLYLVRSDICCDWRLLLHVCRDK
jgi:hypothetical protein